MTNSIDYWYQKYLQEKKRADNLQSAIEVAEDHAYLAGQEAMREQFEKNRLASCDNMTEEEADREQEFVTYFLEKNLYAPTYSDAIEYGKRLMIDKACEWLESNVEKYIYNATPSYPDADFKACVGGKCWEYFRKAMEI